MKLIVAAERGRLELREVPEPTPERDEALIAVKACGVCGSERPAKKKPGDPIGHEIAGIVERPGASGLLKEGDRVVLNVVCGCGRCELCRSGHENYCPQVSGGKYRPRGAPEKVAFVERNCLKIPDDMSFETAIAVGGCGIGVAWHGLKRLNVEQDEPVCVFGVGPIGLSAVMCLVHAGARPVAFDISSCRLDMAQRFGAIETIRSDDQEALKSALADWRAQGMRASVVCTGAHEAANAAVACLAPHGRMLVVGGLSAWPLNSYGMIGQGDKSILGTWHYHRCEWPELLKMVADGVPADKLVTHVFPFSQANEAYDVFESGKSGKVVLTPE